MNNLLDDLQTSFLNKAYISKGMYSPKILVNDFQREKKVLSSILYQLNHCDHFFISVAFLTTGGVAVLREALDKLQRKNINGVIVVSQYLNFTDPAALKRLLEYTNIDLRIDTSNNFHAKCFYFQNGNESTAIIGSSNLTDNALCKNYEFNIQLSSHTDGEIVDQIKKEQQLIYARSVEVTNDFITQYQTYYDALKQSKKEMETLLPMQNGKIVPNKMQTAALQNESTRFS